MLDGLIQQFAGGSASSLEGQDLHGGVAQMLEGASNEHGSGAISEAVSALGGSGLQQSVQQGAAAAAPEQRSGLASMLMSAISQGGGSPQQVQSQLGIGGGAMGPQELGTLARYVGENHPNALSQVMGNQLGNGGGGSVLSVLGNPMVRQIGMNLAQRLL